MPVFAPPPIGMFALRVGDFADDRLSQAIVIVAWGDLTEYEPVGCARVSFSGDMGPRHALYYGYYGNRLTTDPSDGVVLALNGPTESAHSVEATVAGNVASSEEHVFVAGSTHIIFVFYDKETYPQNPTPSWCQ